MTASNSLKQNVQVIINKLVDKIAWIILAAITSLLVCWGTFYFFSHHAITITTTADVRNLIISGVHNLSELNTVSTDSKATIVVKQDKKIFGIPVGDTNLIYEGVGTIRAGIDLKQLKILELDNNQSFIQVLLPSPYINDVSLNVNRSSILADYRNWFGAKAGAELYDKAQNQAIAKIKEEACANNILEQANSNAEVLINDILTKAGFQKIQIDTQTPESNACSIAGK